MHRIISVLFRYFGLIADLFRVSMLFRVLIYVQFTLLIVIGLGAFVFGSQRVEYSFAQKTVCAHSFVLFPRITHVSMQDYQMAMSDITKVGSYPLVAKKVCITPSNVPAENSTATLVLRYIPGIARQIVVQTKTYPHISKQLSSLSIISVSDPLILPLSTPDNTFTYLLSANNKITVCVPTDEGKNITCDVTQLALQHATSYEFTLTRTFNNNIVSTLSSARVETVTPIKVVSSSIEQNGLVYDKPHEITVQFDKLISATSGISLIDESSTSIPIVSKTTNKSVVVTFSNELTRGKNIH